jgi:hypothetical protein
MDTFVKYNCKKDTLPKGIEYKIENNDLVYLEFNLRDKDFKNFILHLQKLIDKHNKDKI